jgi:hypothetical protein
MPLLRLAYAAQLLLAVVAVFTLWSQVGGQDHLDLLPWYWKLGLGGGAAIATVKATASAVSKPHLWNGGTLRWLGILLALLVGCGVASYYAHLYLEPDEEDQQPDNGNVSISMRELPQLPPAPAGIGGAAFRAAKIT